MQPSEVICDLTTGKSSGGIGESAAAFKFVVNVLKRAADRLLNAEAAPFQTLMRNRVFLIAPNKPRPRLPFLYHSGKLVLFLLDREIDDVARCNLPCLSDSGMLQACTGVILRSSREGNEISCQHTILLKCLVA